MSDSWKTLRILTTDHCKYNCVYCHSEDRKPSYESTLMSYEDFLKIMQAAEPLGFRRIVFSGGDPLLNPATVDMAEWADKNTDCEIWIATNGSALTDETAKRLGATRVSVYIHYPAAYDSEYQDITGCPIEPFTKAVRLMDKYGIPHRFNFVLHPDHMPCLDSVIDHVIEAEKQIELLPYVESGFNNISAGIIRRVTDILDHTYASKSFEDEQRVTIWTFGNGGKVRLVKSPCYDRDIDMCQGFGELRITPDLALKKCRFEAGSINLKDMNSEEIRKAMSQADLSEAHCI